MMSGLLLTITFKRRYFNSLKGFKAGFQNFEFSLNNAIKLKTLKVFETVDQILYCFKTLEMLK